MASVPQQTALTGRYDMAADWWQAKIRALGYSDAYEDLVRRAASAKTPSSVADIGTGTGDLAAAYCSVCGVPEHLSLIDSSMAMLTRARKAIGDVAGCDRNLETIHCSLEELGGTRVYDLVLCAHVIEHCADPQRALCHIGALVKVGGEALLVISKPHWCQWVIWLRWQHRWYSAKRVETMAERAGLTVVGRFQPVSGPPSRTSLAYLVRKSM